VRSPGEVANKRRVPVRRKVASQFWPSHTNQVELKVYRYPHYMQVVALLSSFDFLRVIVTGTN